MCFFRAAFALVCLVALLQSATAFRSPVPQRVLMDRSIRVHVQKEEQTEEVKVGSKEYYDGFISSGLNDEPRERVTGDAVLGPTFKFVGGFAVLIVALLLGFMASNGLL